VHYPATQLAILKQGGLTF